MPGRPSRRTLLLAGTGIILFVVLSGIIQPVLVDPPAAGDVAVNSTGVWGAVYMPADAYNTWQMWDQYNETAVERDMAYAAQLDLNAVRVFASYEYWRDNPEAFQQRFDHLLTAADQHNIQVMPVLFESIGGDPRPDRLRDDSIKTSFPVRSPSWGYMAVHAVLPQWLMSRIPRSPSVFVDWFTGAYGTDDRVLAVEIMNEPGNKPFHYRFVDDMLRVARAANPDAALTMGSRELRFNTRYSVPLDVYQFHHNLPPTEENMVEELNRAAQLSEEHNTPIWLTEWQRTRTPLPDEDFPDDHPDYPQKMLPDYESLAPLLRETDRIDGAFLWGLMLKPAYICKPRAQGRINGVFYPDGTVYDLDDARAIAGGDTLDRTERQELPTGMAWFRDKDIAYCTG